MPFVDSLPKAELHVHLEGSLEPEEIFRLAARNGIPLGWPSPAAMRAEYDFTGLEHFLRLYSAGCAVVCHRQDFYDMTAGYLRRAAAQGVRRAEMFLAPENFLYRGIPVADQLGGVLDAVADARTDHGIDGAVLVVAQRHRDDSSALEMLDAVTPFRDDVLGVGLGGPEAGNPPSKFARFFAAARDRGYRLTCHAGEEGPADYVRDALDQGAERIDHGYAAAGDPDLAARLADERIPLTMCPLSNLRLRVTDDLSGYPIRDLSAAGVITTVNSDDPPYFGGYVNENYDVLARELSLTTDDLAALARNSFTASFADSAAIGQGVREVDRYAAQPS